MRQRTSQAVQKKKEAEEFERTEKSMVKVSLSERVVLGERYWLKNLQKIQRIKSCSCFDPGTVV